jgi:hypothetical protein
LVQAFLKKWWVESDFKAPNLPLSLRLKVSAVTITVFKYRNKIGKIVVKTVPKMRTGIGQILTLISDASKFKDLGQKSFRYY